MSVGIGLGLELEGPPMFAEGDYTLTVTGDGPVAASADVSIDWGDGSPLEPAGVGAFAHNFEGDIPLTDYTITAQAVARQRASLGDGSFVNDAAVDSLGRRVTVGSASGFWLIRRYAPNGSLDTSFGTGGTVELNFGLGAGAYAVAVDTSNRIVVGGQNGFDEFRVARLNASNGSLDASFSPGGSDGAGVATVPFGANSRVSAIAIQADGKIVAAGNSGTDGFGDFVVARFHGAAGGVAPNAYQAGDLDTGFDFDGKVTQTVGGLSTLGDVAVAPNGRIVTAGTRHTGGDSAGAVVTFTSTGAANGTYFVDAVAGNELVNALAVGGDGSILLGGRGELAGRGAALLAKLTAAGTLDGSFGTNGAAIYNYQPLGENVTFDAQVWSVVIRDDLSIVAGGTLVNSTISGTFAGSEGLALFGFDADGNQDYGFDSDAVDDGVVYTEADSGVFGGQVSLVGETLIQSGIEETGSTSDAIGVYVETATYAVAVKNVAPTSGIAAPIPEIPEMNPTSLAPGELGLFGFLSQDPSFVDGLTQSIDWGDGVIEQFSGGFGIEGAPVFALHEFQASGLLQIKLTVTDDDGAVSNVSTFNVNVAASSGIVDDPVNPNKTVLYVAAPASRPLNKINVNSGTSSTSVVVDGTTVFFAANPVDRVVVYGNCGDDTIQVNGTTSAAAMEFYGGPGADKLKGANKADVLVGGDGADLVTGGAGRDLLVGGFGEDKVVGDADDDILIGGNYVDAVSREPVAAVMAEWTSSRTYNQRVANLRDGVMAPNGNGPYGLVGHDTAQLGQLAQNVFDDGSVDKLTGDAGTDWFFANVDGVAKDKITDLLGGEFTDADRAFVAA